MVFGNFSILKDGVEIASTNDILLPGTSLDVAKGRRAVWFVDISVANGLQVYIVIFLRIVVARNPEGSVVASHGKLSSYRIDFSSRAYETCQQRIGIVLWAYLVITFDPAQHPLLGHAHPLRRR